MAYRNGNYSAFYVDEPFSESNLRANATPDFIYYNLLLAWKGKDPSFPFIDSHNKTYNVRDDSDWDKTLKPRLHKRLANSKNIILFLSPVTKDSRALHEEIDYGINMEGLPVIVVYPEYKDNSEIVDGNKKFKRQIIELWDRLPIFKKNMGKIPTLHVPLDKRLIKMALMDADFMLGTMKEPNTYSFKP